MKKRIVFFVNSLTGGGAEKVLQTLLNGWEGRGWDISVYCLKKEDVPPGYPRSIAFHFLLDSLRKGDGFWTRLKVKAGNKLKLLVYRHCPPPVFYRMFVRGTYDVEAAFIEGYATRIASGSPNPDSRKLAWVHIDLAANHWTLPAYRNAEEEKRAYRQFDTVVSVSRDVRESVVALAGPLRDARVLYNPIDAQAIREKSAEFVPQRPEGKMLFCASGRLVRQKGFRPPGGSVPSSGAGGILLPSLDSGRRTGGPEAEGPDRGVGLAGQDHIPGPSGKSVSLYAGGGLDGVFFPQRGAFHRHFGKPGSRYSRGFHPVFRRPGAIGGRGIRAGCRQ